MRIVRRAVYAPSLGSRIGPPYIGNLQRRNQHALGIPQCDRFAFLNPLREHLTHIEIHRNRPEHATCQAHVLADALVIVAGEEALKRRECAVHQQIKVAQLARGQIPGRTAASLLFLDIRPPLGQVEILEFTAMRFLECTHRTYPYRISDPTYS